MIKLWKGEIAMKIYQDPVLVVQKLTIEDIITSSPSPDENETGRVH